MSGSDAVRVELDMFSGRENPSWTLTADQARELVGLLSELPLCQQAAEPPALGYRGFKLTSPPALTDLPERVRVYRGIVFVGEAPELTCYRDIRGVERWLTSQAAEKGYASPEDLR